MKLRNLLFIVLAAIVFCNCQSYQPTSLTVASYNLRNANGSDSARGDGWGQRYPVIAQMVQYHDFRYFRHTGMLPSPTERHERSPSRL